MPVDPTATDAFDFALEVEGLYAMLMQRAASLTEGLAADHQPSLGGKLLDAGELDAHGRALMVAGNIAGAASLAATADAAAQKLAVRDGVADFLVNSLDEALRILKNEIRKRETVAVCVAGDPELVKREMLQRGVQADLTRNSSLLSKDADNRATLIWRVEEAPARWLPILDAMAMEGMDSSDVTRRRWLRLAPRYLGRLLRGMRVMRCDANFAEGLIERVRERVAAGEIAVAVNFHLTRNGDREEIRIEPIGS